MVLEMFSYTSNPSRQPPSYHTHSHTMSSDVNEISPRLPIILERPTGALARLAPPTKPGVFGHSASAPLLRPHSRTLSDSASTLTFGTIATAHAEEEELLRVEAARQRFATGNVSTSDLIRRTKEGRVDMSALLTRVDSFVGIGPNKSTTAMTGKR